MNDNRPSIKKIVALILDLEGKYDLLEWEIDGVFVWQSARISIYLLLIHLIVSNNAYLHRPTFLKKLKIFYKRAIINSLFYNPFLDFNKAEALLFESSRKYFVDDTYIDIYTEYFCDELKQSTISYTKYNTSYAVDDLAPRSFKVKHIDFIYIASKILSKIINVTISESNMTKLKIIETKINLSLSVRVDLQNILINEIKRFKSQYPFFKLLIQLKKPKEIYLTDSTSKAPLIKAAKDSNVIVNELQHGLIVKEDLVANYPNTLEDSLQYFPNKFFLWEDLTMCTSKIPLSENNIVFFKNKHLQYMLNKSQNIERKENQILVISQSCESKEILKFVIDNIEEMQNWQFVYKLHPGENHDFFLDVSIHELSKFNNLNIINNEQSIYTLFAESKYVLGVFSTAVFEASYFGCEVILLNLPGVEQAGSLIEQKKAKLIDTNARLSNYL